MAIQVQRRGKLFTAEVTPPHGNGTPWRSPRPMTVGELVDELRKLGCHQTDIGDALYEADPDWERAE